MATTKTATPAPEVPEAAKKITTIYLDGVERTITGVTDFQRKLAQNVKPEPAATLLEAQADLTDDLTAVTLTAARELLT
jgi:hypothetical protein